MATFVRNNPLNTEAFRVDVPLNMASPIRIALLGGEKTGKTSLISKLTQGIYTDTYYPTVQTNSNLFTFSPTAEPSISILDAQGAFDKLGIDDLVLSPVLSQVKKPTMGKRSRSASDSTGVEILVHNRTELYKTYNLKSEITGDSTKVSPHVTPILVELIDTPAYKSNFIPFLESSLYTNLDKEILKNLANEPRRHVLTMPLLVASGAGELNGSVDGYFYVYSAIPSYHPPSYGSEDAPSDHSLALLQHIKSSIDEAWSEFYTYKKNWEEGKEADIYSFKGALKNFLNNKNIEDVESKKLSKRKFYTDLETMPSDPADPKSPPPIWIICTHSKSSLASPTLIEEGRNVAKKWKCGYISVDIIDGQLIDHVLALIIREVIERRKLQSQREGK